MSVIYSERMTSAGWYANRLRVRGRYSHVLTFEGEDETAFSDVKKLVLVPVPVERGCQVVELVRYFLQVNGPMRRLYLADGLPGLRRSPDSRSYTVVLLQRFLFDSSCPLDVERHVVFRI